MKESRGYRFTSASLAAVSAAALFLRFRERPAAIRALLAFLAAAVIGGHLWGVSRLRFAFDDAGFVHGGRRTAYGDVKEVDRSKWEKKGILKVDGITLDAWHHTGVREFEKRLKT